MNQPQPDVAAGEHRGVVPAIDCPSPCRDRGAELAGLERLRPSPEDLTIAERLPQFGAERPSGELMQRVLTGLIELPPELSSR